MKINSILAFFLTLTFFTSCEDPDVMVIGMEPIYADPLDFSLIKTEEPREFNELGKIVRLGDYLFINEILQGIHVVNNENPENPENEYFIVIPGNREFTIDNNILYADNSIHLLLIDISDIENPKVDSYIEDFYQLEIESFAAETYYPLDYEGAFYCYDRTKGIIIGWEESTLTNPHCFTY